jgi:hypothetical protein
LGWDPHPAMAKFLAAEFSREMRVSSAPNDSEMDVGFARAGHFH